MKNTKGAKHILIFACCMAIIASVILINGQIRNDMSFFYVSMTIYLINMPFIMESMLRILNEKKIRGGINE